MKKLSLILALMITCISLCAVSITAFAENKPVLKSISFKNAVIDSEFASDVSDYTLTLTDNTVPPTLEKYELEGEANIFINYEYDETNHQTGLTTTIQYDAGSRIYHFEYSNPASYVKNGNNTLSSIYTMYGELSPALNDRDTDYKLYIPRDLTQLTITPVTSDIYAYCAPVELELTSEQMPIITLTCIASNGSKRDYNLSIKRVDKTVEQVELEMNDPDYKSFVTGTRLFEKPEFIVICCCTIGGILIIAVLFKVTRRLAANPYDSDEPPFYCSAD